MSTMNLTIDKDSNGNAILMKNSQTVTTITIKNDKNMNIDVGAGFGTGAFICSFKTFAEVNGAKGSLTGTWNRSVPNTQPSTEFSIATSGTTGILVTDTDDVADDQMFFSVQVDDGGTIYDSDPELKVKKIGG